MADERYRRLERDGQRGPAARVRCRTGEHGGPIFFTLGRERPQPLFHSVCYACGEVDTMQQPRPCIETRATNARQRLLVLDLELPEPIGCGIVFHFSRKQNLPQPMDLRVEAVGPGEQPVVVLSYEGLAECTSLVVDEAAFDGHVALARLTGPTRLEFVALGAVGRTISIGTTLTRVPSIVALLGLLEGVDEA